MPNLRDIQEFASELRRLGNETEILRKRGEPVEEPVSPPSGGPGSPAGPGAAEEPGEEASSSGSFAAFPEDQEPEAGSDETLELDEGLPPDIDQLLAGLGEEPFEEPPPLPEEEETEDASGEPGAGTESPEEDAFLDELLRESSAAEESEMTSIGGQPEEEVAPSGEAFGFEGPAAETLPPDEPTGFEASGEASGSEPGVGIPASEPPEESEAAEPDFGGAELEAPGFEEPEHRAPSAEELPDESLFFDVPSPEDVGPPEELGFPEEEGPGELGAAFEETGGGGETGESELPVPAGVGAEGFEEEFEEESLGPEEETFEEPVFEEPAYQVPEPAEVPETPPSGEEGGAPEDFVLPEGLGGDFENIGAGEEGPVEEGAIEFEMPEGFELPTFDAEEPSAGPAPPSAGAGVDEFEMPQIPEEEQPTANVGVPEEGAGAPGGAGEPEMSAELEPPTESMFDESEFEMPTGESVEAPIESSIEEPDAGGGESEASETRRAAGGAAAAAVQLDDSGLGDIGEQFGLFGEGEPPPSEEELNPALAVGGAPPEPEPPGPAAPSAVGAEPSDIKLSDRDFERIQQTLSTLPRNLRIAVEELIGEQDLGGRRLSQLVSLLVRGASPHQIAELTSRILGRKIEIPASYEKRTGLEFEEERATFGYRFRHNILPILRVFLAGAAIIALLVFLGFRYVYRPIHAYTLYEQGYGQLQNDNFMTANQDFNAASRQWQMKNWYYRYADGYINKKQYSFAADKYDALLKVWPGDRKGIFDYANMESKILGNYSKANTLLDRILNENQWDYQGLMQAGDNYLRWGREDPSKLDLARRDFAMLLQHYGASNPVLFKMLRYFILTDNFKQVETLKNQFQADPHIKVDPLAYADLGGYLIDKNRLSDVHDILFRALKVDPTLPETNYNLARYFKKIGNYPQEGVALQRALTELQHATPLSQERLGMLVDTYDRVGENLYREKRYLDAEQAYNKGISRYETALKQNQLKPTAEFGKLYANLGDLNYYVSGKYDQALNLYQQAASNGYNPPELRYREGYIHYRNQDYRAALLRFMSAAGNFSDNRDLLYATANTFFKRNDFSAAEGYYLNLLNMLETERRSIKDFQPDQVPAQRDLLVNMMKVYNNLGVTLYELSKRTSDAQKYSQGLVNLTHSMEAFDQLTRNPVTLQKSPAVNLAFINTKDILYPTSSYQVQIYSDLPQDMGTKSF